MPFAVFRKHQRKLLAIFAILAMFGFVLSDSLPALVGGRGGQGRGGANDPVVAKLNWKSLHASDLEPMRLQRQRANFFLAAVFQGDRNTPQQFFGGTTTRDLVDALILEHEAQSLGMPATTELANQWLRQRTGGMASPRLFEEIYRGSNLSQQVTDEQLLLEIANQIRIQDVRNLPFTAETTPLDVYAAYRDQSEKVSAYAAPVRVEEFVSKAPAPSEAEIGALYESAKNRYPDPNRPDPGFKIAQKVKYEMVTADVPALADTIRPKLTTQELRDTYEARKVEFPANPGELPLSLFAGAPDLTPHDAFPDVKERVAFVLSEEKAREEINGKFDDLKNNVMRPFEDKYFEAVGSEGKAASRSDTLKPGDLIKSAAAKAGLTYEATPLVPATDPDKFGPIAKSRVGTVASFDSSSPSFLELAYAPKTTLYDPLELSGDGGRRFLAWKVEDVSPRVPSLQEIREDVIRAWKLAKARPLAEAEAKALAAAAEKAGGGAKLKDVVGKRAIIQTEPRPKMMFAPMMDMRSFGRPRPAEIPEIPQAGDAIRTALFSLEPKTSAVAADDSQSVYYALTLKEREPVDFDGLYSMGTNAFMLQEVSQEALLHRVEDWKQTLRLKAGLPADWTPPVSDRRGQDVAESDG
ncbi:MAG: hypothetical protein JWN86_1149 [Planctomycetota bacterium]|nr:hypothetical protein [Planctomycetota bacterium]